MIFTWYFLVFHDIPGLGKYGFWCSENEMGKPKPSVNRRENNTGNTNDNREYQFETPRKSSKMKKAGTNKDVSAPKHFEILKNDIEENGHDLNENHPINNSTDSNKDNEKAVIQQKHKNSCDSYFRRLNHKKCIWTQHFKGCKHLRSTLL